SPAAVLASLGTISAVEPLQVHTLRSWKEGMTVELPLPDGTVRPGRVEFVQEDAAGWVRTSGSISDEGSFSFAANGTRLAGMVQLPREGFIWQLKPQEDGAPAYVRRPLDE